MSLTEQARHHHRTTGQLTRSLVVLVAALAGTIVAALQLAG